MGGCASRPDADSAAVLRAAADVERDRFQVKRASKEIEDERASKEMEDADFEGEGEVEGGSFKDPRRTLSANSMTKKSKKAPKKVLSGGAGGGRGGDAVDDDDGIPEGHVGKLEARSQLPRVVNVKRAMAKYAPYNHTATRVIL